MKKSIIVAIAIIVLLATLGFFVMKSIQNNNKVSKSKTNTTSVTNTANVSQGTASNQKVTSSTSTTNTNSTSVKTNSEGENIDVECNQIYNDLFKEEKKDFTECGVFAKDISCDGESAPKEEKQNNLVIIFDSSGSMAGQIGGKAKIDIAKEAVWKFLDSMKDSKTKVSVVVYGHKGSNNSSSKQLSCSSIDEAYYFGDLDVAVAKNKISEFKPTGWTPIASSLDKAKDILVKNTKDGDVNSILLISDGEETCDGNPISKAKEIRDSTGITTSVIAFDVTGNVQAQLKSISENGGGTFHAANSLEEMFAALDAENDKFWEKYECESEQWSEWLDKSLDTVFVGNSCAQNLFWEKNGMIDMGIESLGYNDVADSCKQKIIKDYRENRYKAIREQLIKNYIANFIRSNKIIDDSEIWTDDIDYEGDMMRDLKSNWNNQWDNDIDWNAIQQQIKTEIVNNR